jgi:predicted 2-oxoglutarate/Fe(II)-dependent dioxygenase YbiX
MGNTNQFASQLILDDDYERPIINILNYDDLIDQIEKAKITMKQSTFKMTDGNERFEDVNVRNSKIAEMMINIKINSVSDHIKYIHNEFEYIEYNIGGHFVEHIDYERDLPDGRKSNATFLIYPPQNVVGGNLVVKDKLNNKYVISPSSEKWIIIIFKCDLLHCSEPVIAGQKVILKGQCII